MMYSLNIGILTLVFTLPTFHGLVDADFVFPKREGTPCLPGVPRHCSGDWKGYVDCPTSEKTGDKTYGPATKCGEGERCGYANRTLGIFGYGDSTLGCIAGKAPSRAKIECEHTGDLQCDNNGKDIWMCAPANDAFEKKFADPHWQYYDDCPYITSRRNASCTPGATLKYTKDGYSSVLDINPLKGSQRLCNGTDID